MKNALMVLTLLGTILFSLSVQAIEHQFSVTNELFTEMHGVNTITMTIDYDKKKIEFDRIPWFRETSYNIVFVFGKLVYAVSEDQLSIVQVNYLTMEVVIGDLHKNKLGAMSFGKTLTTPIVQK